MSSQDRQAIIDKLNKLMAKQVSLEEMGSLKEAEVFAAKASELMAQYQISNSELGFEEKKEPVEREVIVKEEVLKKNDGRWAISLYSTIARYNFCFVILRNNGNDGIWLIGEAYNRMIVKSIVSSLKTRIREICRLELKKSGFSGNKNTWVRSFYEGVVMGLNDQLKAQRAQMVQQVEFQSSLPMVINKNEIAIRDYIQTTFGRLGKATARGSSNADARATGVATGRGMSIGSGVSIGSNRKTIG